MAWPIRLLLGILTASIGAFGAYEFVGHPEDREDPLCALARDDFKMNCSILAAPGVYQGGAIVNVSMPSGEISKVGFPILQILGSSCAVGPTVPDFATFKEQPGQSVAFGRREFTVGRNASIGARLKVPEADFDLQAGPNVSDLRSVVLSADSAQVFTVDQTALQDTINACSIRTACTNNISANQGIVTRLLVAKNLQYSVKDKDGAVFPLEMAVKKGLISVGAQAGRKSRSSADLSTGADMVFAVEISRPSQFNFAACQSPLKILKVTGRAKVRAVTKTDIVDEQESSTDKEAAARVTYTLPASERINDNDSIDSAEARAVAKWSMGAGGSTILLDSNVFAASGMRYHSMTQNPKATYASSSATTELVLRADVVNRDLLSKELVLTLNIDLKKNVSITRYQLLRDLMVTLPNGESRNVPAIWDAGDKRGEFSLGKIEPGQLIGVSFTRAVTRTSASNDDKGFSDERLIVSFELK